MWEVWLFAARPVTQALTEVETSLRLGWEGGHRSRSVSAAANWTASETGRENERKKEPLKKTRAASKQARAYYGWQK